VTGRHKMLMEQLQEKMTYLSNSHVFNTWWRKQTPQDNVGKFICRLTCLEKVIEPVPNQDTGPISMV
jgi:hypothetical protein